MNRSNRIGSARIADDGDVASRGHSSFDAGHVGSVGDEFGEVVNATRKTFPASKRVISSESSTSVVSRPARVPRIAVRRVQVAGWAWSRLSAEAIAFDDRKSSCESDALFGSPRARLVPGCDDWGGPEFGDDQIYQRLPVPIQPLLPDLLNVPRDRRRVEAVVRPGDADTGCCPRVDLDRQLLHLRRSTQTRAAAAPNTRT